MKLPQSNEDWFGLLMYIAFIIALVLMCLAFIVVLMSIDFSHIGGM